MKISVRIISLILIFSILFLLFALPVTAASTVASYLTKEVVISEIVSYLVGQGISFLGDKLLSFNGDGYGECSMHPSGLHDWVRSGFGGTVSGDDLFAYRCSYCGLTGTFTSDMYSQNYRDWVASLDIGIIGSSGRQYDLRNYAGL